MRPHLSILAEGTGRQPRSEVTWIEHNVNIDKTKHSSTQAATGVEVEVELNASQGYQLVRRLGFGASGPVYLAKTATGWVAIREFKSASEPGSLSWEGERTRFLEAGRSSLALKHPRIVPVLEIVDEGGEAFIVTEYVEGETLEEAVSARRFSLEEANNILRQIAFGLDFAHSHGVVHGDLKPSDIFLVPKSGVKVVDFGTSLRVRWDSRTPLPANLTHRYLSPERLLGTESLTARSDQYSLAAIAYRMYTGRPPDFQAPSGSEGATRQAEIAPPSRIDPNLPPAIDGPMLRGLDRDPKRRYDSCREFQGALEAVLIAPEDGHSRRGLRVGICVAVALIGILALAAFLVSRHRSDKPSLAVIAKPEPALGPLIPLPSPAPHVLPKERPPKGSAYKPPLLRPTPDKPPQHRPAIDLAHKPTLPVAKPKPFDDAPRQPAVPRPAPGYTIEVFSRFHPIENGSTFSFNDPDLGELGLGDLRVVVNAEGRPPARGSLKLEWSVDGKIVAPPRPVALKDLVEYGNEPTAGSYRLTLKLAGQPVQVFSFTITP